VRDRRPCEVRNIDLLDEHPVLLLGPRVRPDRRGEVILLFPYNRSSRRWPTPSSWRTFRSWGGRRKSCHSYATNKHSRWAELQAVMSVKICVPANITRKGSIGAGPFTDASAVHLYPAWRSRLKR
jgi:hypothetical protein